MLLAATEIGTHGARSGGRPGGFLFLILLGLLGLMLVRRRAHRHGVGHGGTNPMSRLQQRFANGEINQAEFEHRRAVLRNDKNIPAAPANMAPPERQPVDEPDFDDES